MMSNGGCAVVCAYWDIIENAKGEWQEINSDCDLGDHYVALTIIDPEADREFPFEELKKACEIILNADGCPSWMEIEGKRIQVTIKTKSPNTDSDCCHFYE